MDNTYRHTFATKSGGEGGTSTTISITFDYSTSTRQDILGWATSNRVIAAQKWIKLLSPEDAKALAGSTILAKDAGKKPASAKDVLASILALKTSNPELYKEALGMLETEHGTTDE